MRILVVSQYFWPENFRVNELVAQLVRRGHTVTVLTGIPNYPEGRVFAEFARDPSRYSRYQGVDVVRVPMLPRGQGKLRLALNYLSFAISATVCGLFKLRRRAFDVIFVFEPSPVTVGIPAVALRRAKRAPIVFWVLDQWPETLAAVGVLKAPVLLRAVGWLVTWIYHRCDLVLAQSHALVPQVQRYCADPGKVRYFPNWADLGEFDGSAEPAPELDVAPGVFTVMYAGNLGEAQDLPAVIDSVRAMPQGLRVRWVFVGAGRMEAWLREAVARHDLAQQVLLLGRFPPERMPSFFRHADALLVSLRRDPVFSLTVPGKVQTYLAAGIPIAAMLDGEGARVVRESGAGLACAAGDSQGLADAVTALSRMAPDQRREMGLRGRAYSAREFQRDVLIGRLESWFAEVQR